LVIRNGKLIAEAYPHTIEDRGQFANIQSCTKSVTSIMVGIAMQNGMDISVGDRLHDIYPDLFDGNTEKQEITLADALTMRTGLAFDNDKNSRELYMTKKNSAAYVLGFPMVDKPGTVWNYNDGAPQLVSKMIETKTGETEAAYAGEKLFKPLGITEWKWESAHDGTSFGAYGLYLKPRDLAKIGQLLLQKGKWLGETIIDSTYLALATSVKVDSADDGSYGYYFWVDSRNHGFYAYGHGGQLLLVVPDKNLVLLYTAWPYTSSDFFDDGFDMFDLIVDGCR
jgi:CubicO group peptidase (beta-lactamase class C family)